MNGPDRPEQRDRRRWMLFFLALLLLSILCLGMSLFYPPWWSAGGHRIVPVALHSVLRADYSADALAASLPQVDLGLIENAIQDQEQTSVPDRLATVIGDLQTPVPTVTPYDFIQPTGVFVPTPLVTLTVTRTQAGGMLTATPSRTATPPGATAIASPTRTGTATSTPGAGTPTKPGVTATKLTPVVATPTNTPVTPVYTPQPTDTPRPTNTPAYPPPPPDTSQPTDTPRPTDTPPYPPPPFSS